MSGRFGLDVYDKGYVRKGPVGSPIRLEGELVDNGVDSFEFDIPTDNPRAGDLTTPGARVVLHYKPEGEPWVPLTSGRVDGRRGFGPKSSPKRTIRVIGDWAVLSDEVQCWPNPTGSPSQQGDNEAYHTVKGPAETVLKSILAPNVARQGTVLTIPASAGLGSTITGSVRFHTVADRLMPLIDEAGLSVRVIQDGSSRRLDVFEPTVRPQVLTQDSGVVVAGEYEVSAPTVTRVILAAGGEGTARIVRQKVDAALEAEYGIVLAAFVDARDIQQDMDADPSGTAYEAELEERMAEKLAEGAPKASLKAELAETNWFRFKKAYDIGTRVRMRLAGETEPIEDRIRRITFSATVDDGVKFSPIVGEWSDTAEEDLIKRVVALTRAVGDLERR